MMSRVPAFYLKFQAKAEPRVKRAARNFFALTVAFLAPLSLRAQDTATTGVRLGLAYAAGTKPPAPIRATRPTSPGASAAAQRTTRLPNA